MKLLDISTGYTFTPFMSTPSNRQAVFVIIPAFNEQAVIRDVLEQFRSYNYSVVVVDDGSSKMLEEFLAGMPVYQLRHKVNLGQGAALQTGIEFALSKDAAYIVTFDADGQHDVKDIAALTEPLMQHKADIALGSRFLKNTAHNIPAKRKFLLQLARRFNFLFTGLLLSDAHNGLRAMTRKAALSIRIKENGMAHATEILIQIKKKKLNYVEIPVNIYYSEYSKRKGQTTRSGFRIIFDILLNKIFK